MPVIILLSNNLTSLLLYCVLEYSHITSPYPHIVVLCPNVVSISWYCCIIVSYPCNLIILFGCLVSLYQFLIFCTIDLHVYLSFIHYVLISNSLVKSCVSNWYNATCLTLRQSIMGHSVQVLTDVYLNLPYEICHYIAQTISLNDDDEIIHQVWVHLLDHCRHEN